MRVWKSSSEPELPAPMPRRCPAPFARCVNWPVSKDLPPAGGSADVRVVTEKDGGMRLLEREAQAMMRAGVAATVGAPSLCPLPAAAALTVKDMGMLNPARFLRYLAAEAARNGVKIYEGSRATSLETNMVHTERGKHSGARIS